MRLLVVLKRVMVNWCVDLVDSMCQVVRVAVYVFVNRPFLWLIRRLPKLLLEDTELLSNDVI